MKLFCTQLQHNAAELTAALSERGTRMKGYLSFGVGPQDITLIGGPFQNFDRLPLDLRNKLFTVRMAREIPYEADHVCGVQDFSVPTHGQAESMVLAVLGALEQGKVPFIGCMAGQGRTGLAMAVILKAFNPEMSAKDIVGIVRTQYYPHAVETDEQQDFVDDFLLSASGQAALDRFESNMHWKYWLPWLPVSNPHLPR